MKKPVWLIILTTINLINSYACTTIIVGKKASMDGSILVARNEDGDNGNAAVHQGCPI